MMMFEVLIADENGDTCSVDLPANNWEEALVYAKSMAEEDNGTLVAINVNLW